MKLTRDEVISRFVEVHGDKYDYSLVEYVSTHKKVKIICKEHGVFEQIPSAHKRGIGCPMCTSGAKRTTKQAIVIFKTVHGDKYLYDKVDYNGSSIRIKIGCKTHGYFMQKPNEHTSGKGCRKCSDERLQKQRCISDVEILKVFHKTHLDKYDYSNMKYVGKHHKIEIMCKEHGSFYQTPHAHTRGQGCPSCAVTGFDISKPATLYYLSINNGEAYKIGITNRSVEERYKKYDLDKIKILKMWEYPRGQYAKTAEEEILKDFNYARWKGEPLLGSGNSELFTHDVLCLDSD